MTFRAKIIVIVVAVLVLIGIAYSINRLLNWQSKKGTSSNTTQQTNTQTSTNTDTNTPTTGQNSNSNTDTSPSIPASQPLPPIGGTESDLVGIAMPFVERMGSFSNQDTYSNLQDLLPFMSASMKTWAQGKIDDAKKGSYQKLYTGTTTKVLSYKVPQVNDTSANLTMTTQRSESVGNVNNTKVYNQDVSVRMVKEGGIWLIDGVDWK